MQNRFTLLTKMADRLLKASDKIEALNKSRERSDKIKKLHESISERYKFKVTRHENLIDIECDVKFLKLIEKTLSPTLSQENKLDALFKKYSIK
jgi:gamma-glutamyl phosphate reductase